MRIDWIISVVIFLMFVTWGFAHYSLLGSSQTVSRSDTALSAAEKISDYMSAELLITPVNITSDADANGVTVWTYMDWTAGQRNSTLVVLDRLSGTSLDCSTTDQKLYWEANLTTGDNYFFIKNIDWEVPINCNQSITIGDDNQTSMWGTESLEIFSSDKNSQICTQINQSYQTVKRTIGVTFDFNVLVEQGGLEYECGTIVPASGRDVFVFPFSGSLWEGGDVNISVRLW
ncbi:MAG: hypothetical protein JSV63_00485 [Candidatus Aenigmatarchaeota archaeon]|nr:MAG: hypothetical protein JSV63_00485 [Candidatus Aenigmarchaeota archaeon]